MSRFLVAGVCPLPFDPGVSGHAPGLRTWQLARGLAAAGHSVQVVAVAAPGTPADDPAPVQEVVDGVAIRRLTGGAFADADLRPFVSAFGPDAVVGATIYGSYAAAQAAGSLPLWADQFGHVMAEAQAKAWGESANWPLAYFWRMVRLVMARADKVSVVSEAQRLAAIGELGALGRLNAESCGYEFTEVVPALAEPLATPTAAGVARGVRLPEDALLVLWSGSYNVWSDPETLFQGLEQAMARLPGLHFVSTGGGVAGLDERSYAGFERRVEASALRERFHLLGWVPAETVARVTAEADLGVVTERPIYEGRVGTRTRVLRWLASGLPVLGTRHGELGELIERRKLGLTFAPGDAGELAGRLVWADAHRGELAVMSEAARSLAREELSLERTTRPLVRWAEAPARAPDAAVPWRGDPMGCESALLRPLRRPGVKRWVAKLPGLPWLRPRLAAALRRLG